MEENRDKCLLLVMATVYAFGGTDAREFIAQNSGNINDVVPVKEVTTKAMPGNDSEPLFLTPPLDNRNWTTDYVVGQPYAHNDFTDWFGLEENWSRLLNYSALPDDDETKAFVMQYSNDLERRMLVMQLSYCPFMPLCSHSLNVREEYPIGSCCQSSCSCHNNCPEYDNCCLDKMLDFQDNRTDQRKQSCFLLHLNRKLLTSYSRAAYGVADCPATSAYMNREKCEHSYHSNLTLADILPVWHSGSGLVYRNMHCALCNGVHSEELNFFKAKMECHSVIHAGKQTTSELIQHVLAGNDCDISFWPDSFEPEYCQYSNTVSSCNVTGQWTNYDPDYELGCGLYTSEVESGDRMLFKNVFCAFCNGYTDIPRTCYADHDSPAIPFPFSRLLTFAAHDDESVGDRKCNAGFIYHDTSVSVINVIIAQLII